MELRVLRVREAWLHRQEDLEPLQGRYIGLPRGPKNYVHERMVSFLGFRQDRDSVRDRQWRVQRSSGNRHICRYGVQPETLRGYDPAYGDLDFPAHIREVLKLNNRRDPGQEHLPAVRNHLQNNFLDPQLLVRQRLQTTSYQRRVLLHSKHSNNLARGWLHVHPRDPQFWKHRPLQAFVSRTWTSRADNPRPLQQHVVQDRKRR